jgi:hypothetical protein
MPVSLDHEKVRVLYRELIKGLTLYYVAGIPLIPWFTYMIAKNWEVSLWEVAWLTILTFCYALLHVYAMTKYDEAWCLNE